MSSPDTTAKLLPVSLLGLSGSLRSGSYNTLAIEAAQILSADCSSTVDFTIGSIADLPLFNPDREDEHIPALAQLKHLLDQADGLVIASPEYAHGISGPMKNALDWLVSGFEFHQIPIMLINTSPRASHAQDSLIEVLTTMSGTVIKEACVSIPLLGTDLDVKGVVEDSEISNALIKGMNQFCSTIEKIRQGEVV